MAATNNRDKIKKVMEDASWNQLAIRASLARMQQESNFNPNAINEDDAGPGEDSEGILQWNRERKTNLRKFAQQKGLNVNDVTTQALFYVEEAEGRIGTEGGYGKKLLSASTSREAADAAISMARPKGWTKSNPSGGHNYDNLLKLIRSGNLSEGATSEEKAPEETEIDSEPTIDLTPMEPEKEPGWGDALIGIIAAGAEGAKKAKETNKATIDQGTMLRSAMNDPLGPATISGIMSTVRRLF